MIDVEALLSNGYKEYPATIGGYRRLFQKAVKSADSDHHQYFVNFRLWDLGGRISFDAELCCETDTGGYLWATIQEESIEATERRAHAIWSAGGTVWYESEVAR